MTLYHGSRKLHHIAEAMDAVGKCEPSGCDEDIEHSRKDVMIERAVTNIKTPGRGRVERGLVGQATEIDWGAPEGHDPLGQYPKLKWAELVLPLGAVPGLWNTEL